MVVANPVGGPGPTAAAARGSASVYGEELYLGLLANINGSERRVEGLCRLALRHLPQAVETWSAIRRAFVVTADPHSLVDLDGDRNRALWCLVDSLLKHAPSVFAPLIGPRLLEYVTQQTPLQLMASAATAPTALQLFGSSSGGGGALAGTDAAQRAASWSWWEALVLSWQSVLPADVFAAVRHYVTQRKSTAELDGALMGVTKGVDARAATAPASAADMQVLEEEWQALRYLCSAVGGRSAGAHGGGRGGGAGGLYAAMGGFSFEELLASVPRPSSAEATATSAVPTPAGTSAQGPPPQHRQPAGGSSASEDDDEDGDDVYVPTFIPGAKPRALPERNLPAQRRRREARRRPRDDDY